MSKTAAAVLAFAGFLLFSIPMSAQFNGLLPNGNVYGGVSYGQLTDVINKQSYRGLGRFVRSPSLHPLSRLGSCSMPAVTTAGAPSKSRNTTFVGGPRLSINYRKWRPFIHAMAGIRHVNSERLHL